MYHRLQLMTSTCHLTTVQLKSLKRITTAFYFVRAAKNKARLLQLLKQQQQAGTLFQHRKTLARKTRKSQTSRVLRTMWIGVRVHSSINKTSVYRSSIKSTTAKLIARKMLRLFQINSNSPNVITHHSKCLYYRLRQRSNRNTFHRTLWLRSTRAKARINTSPVTRTCTNLIPRLARENGATRPKVWRAKARASLKASTWFSAMTNKLHTIITSSTECI